jgi:hypothetical protein
MKNGEANGSSDSKATVLQDCVETLQRVAEYRLPPTVDNRLLWLSENKDRLTESEREELLALVAWAEDRTKEKLRAQLVMRRLAAQWPELIGPSP